jgi:ABC-type multidrug transport system fused ATPase/permease subunit
VRCSRSRVQLARGIVSLCVLALLLVVDWVVALVAVLALGGTYGLIYMAVRRRQAEIGVRQERANRDRYRTALEALEGIKTVKALEGEDAFVQRFERPSFEFSTALASGQTITQLPRFALETAAFGGIVTVVIYLIGGGGLTEVLPLMGLYAMAGYKLLPSLHAVFDGMARLRLSYASIAHVHRDVVGSDGGAAEVHAPPQADQRRFTIHDGLRLDGVCFRYPGASVLALDRVDMDIPRGSITGVVGPTGAGKTTLVDVILGLLHPGDGVVRVDDRTLNSTNAGVWRRSVGYVPQEILLTDQSIGANVAFGRDSADLDAVASACRRAGLADFIETLPEGVDTRVGDRGVRLSGGQRQRIGIARALYHRPDVLVFDEATNALDGETEAAIMRSLLELAGEVTILVVAHRFATVRRCDSIYLMENGRITANGSYDTLLDTSETFRKMAEASS